MRRRRPARLRCGGYAAAGLLLLAPVLSGRAQTVREVLRDDDVPVGPQIPFDPDLRITSWAAESGPDLFIIAFYAAGRDAGLPDTLRIGVYDRSRAAWVHAALPRRRAAPPAWDVGSVLEIHHTARRIYLDTHTNPSAGTVIVLTRALRPAAALSGWLLRLLPGGLAIHHRSMVHFAPVHSAELWLFDERSGRDAVLYPREPWDRVRRRYVDTTAAIYARLGEAWFMAHNQAMDSSAFNSSLASPVVIGGGGSAAAFVMRFGDRFDRSAAATPVLDVAVRCEALGRKEERCREVELEVLQRRHRERTTEQLLDTLAADPGMLADSDVAGGVVAAPCGPRDGCGRDAPPACPAPEPIPSPLRAETLTRLDLVAFTLHWQVAVPGGDPIALEADGVVDNARAGLAGRWHVADDSTLVIEQTDSVSRRISSVVFRLRRPEGDLVSPPPEAGNRSDPLFRIQRRAASADARVCRPPSP